MNHDDTAGGAGNEEFDLFIDQAIDELFVPKSQRAQAAAEAPPAPAKPAEEPPAAEEPVAEASEDLDLSISWEQKDAAAAMLKRLNPISSSAGANSAGAPLSVVRPMIPGCGLQCALHQTA